MGKNSLQNPFQCSATFTIKAGLHFLPLCVSNFLQVPVEVIVLHVKELTLVSRFSLVLAAGQIEELNLHQDSLSN